MKIQNKEIQYIDGQPKLVTSGVTLVVDSICAPTNREYNGKVWWSQRVIFRDTDDHEYIQYYQAEVSEARKSAVANLGEGDLVKVTFQLSGSAPVMKDGQLVTYNNLRILSIETITKAGGQVVTVRETTAATTPVAPPSMGSVQDDLPF